MEPVRTIGQRYELCAEIASGGMATVHLARQLGAAGFARMVAVKRLHERYARDPDFVAMFLDEARIVSRIHHPNVVSTIDVVVEPSKPLGGAELFIIMEYVHGESLIKVLTAIAKQGAMLPPKIAATILVSVLQGLHEAHEARSEAGEPLGIVHRDVSPHNILIGVDGVARVLDFGVAKASERITSTMEGTLKGKLSYMAPEQLQSEPIDRRTDVYAASVVFWELLSGGKLFHGPSEGTIVQRILTQPVLPPSINNASVPAMLDAVILRGLSRDKDARFATAKEMAMAIEQSIGLASPSELTDLLDATCKTEIEARAGVIANVETRASRRSMQEAALSIRSMTGSLSNAPVGSGSDGSTPNLGAATSSPPFQASAPPLAYGSYSSPPAPSDGPSPSAAKSDGSARRVMIAIGLFVTTFSVAIGVALVFFARRAESRVADEAAFMASRAGAMSSSSSTTTPTCPDGMVLVPGGHFFMGSDDDLPAERPAHNVSLHAYCMDKREVTVAAYRECSDRGDCKRAGTTNKWPGMTARDARTFDPVCTINTSDASRGTHPINCVDWSMADRFCRAERLRPRVRALAEEARRADRRLALRSRRRLRDARAGRLVPRGRVTLGDRRHGRQCLGVDVRFLRQLHERGPDGSTRAVVWRASGHPRRRMERRLRRLGSSHLPLREPARHA